MLVSSGQVGQAEAELKPLGRPLGAFLGQLLQPGLQVLRHHGNLVAPHAVDGRIEAVVFAVVHFTNRPRQPLLRRRQVLDSQRQQTVCLPAAQRRRLHLVEEIAARQRIHFLQRGRRIERGEPVHRGHQELVGTGGIALQRRQRIGPSAQALRRQRCLRGLGRADDSIGGFPLPPVVPQPS